MSINTAEYVRGWNRVVSELKGKCQSECEIYLESLIDLANKNLLKSYNTSVSQGVLDCTREYEKTRAIPALKEVY